MLDRDGRELLRYEALTTALAVRESVEPPPPAPPRAGLLLGLFVAVWLAVMAPQAWWGLPSRAQDDLLFAGKPAWPAEEYRTEATLAARAAQARGADTDLNPLPSRAGLIDLTATPEARAEILRRFRLFSRQPDEMITLMALQRMRPPPSFGAIFSGDFDLDPRLYQYGGAYVYTVAIILKLAGSAGWLTISRDVSAYLERPELFGHVYVATRALSLAGGALVLLAAGRLALRTGRRSVALAAMALVACCPAFVTASLEAKPHVLSCGLILWALLAALEFGRAAAWPAALRLGALAGLAFGVVLTGLLALTLIPAAALSARHAGVAPPARWGRLIRPAAALTLALLVYAGTNPYVVYNALARPERLSGNLGNSTAMYAGQVERLAGGALNTAWLLTAGAGPLTTALGLVGAGVALSRRGRAAWLGAVVATVFVTMGCLLLAGKSLEFARFLLLPIVLLALGAAALLSRLPRPLGSLAGIAVVASASIFQGWPAWSAFDHDRRGAAEARLTAGRYLQTQLQPGEAIAVVAEPAPYGCPPLDFTTRRVVLLPEQEPAVAPVLEELPEWLVLCADQESDTLARWWRQYYKPVASFPVGAAAGRVAWANKPTFILRRRVAD